MAEGITVGLAAPPPRIVAGGAYPAPPTGRTGAGGIIGEEATGGRAERIALGNNVVISIGDEL